MSRFFMAYLEKLIKRGHVGNYGTGVEVRRSIMGDLGSNIEI